MTLSLKRIPAELILGPDDGDIVRVSHTVALDKNASNRLNELKTRAAIDLICSKVNTTARVKSGWNIEPLPYTRNEIAEIRANPAAKFDNAYIFRVRLSVTCDTTPENAKNLDAKFKSIVSGIGSAGALAKWVVAEVDGHPYVQDESQDTETETTYADIEIPEDWGTYFDHLYGLDYHINRTKRALVAGVSSDWAQRPHIALIGPPGCGKSDICASIRDALGEASVMEFDATATTAAGAIKELNEREELPRVLIVEEIEKAADGSMLWLLGLMDMRSSIRKRTARGNIDRKTNMIVIATVNDENIFRNAMAGALYSRFSNRVYFSRPSRDVLTSILTREIERINGDLAWVEPALDLADEMGFDGPREIISLAICGREGLLDGSFRDEMLATGKERPVASNKKFTRQATIEE